MADSSKNLQLILNKLRRGEDDIYAYPFSNSLQETEVKLRRKVAQVPYDNYLKLVSKHHSVPVMDCEVARFLKKIPTSGTVVDIGGGWAWHWRNLHNIRPDVRIFVIDFVKENLLFAKKVIAPILNDQVFLIHGDATDLVFDDNTFDGYWSVQTLQHIPNFSKAIEEAHRILKPGGIFANYSFNTQKPVQIIYKIFRQPYHVKGNVPGKFYIARASEEQRKTIETIFQNPVKSRFTELLFSRELAISFMGKENSLLGKIDALLSGNMPLAGLIARQQSFHTTKPVDNPGIRKTPNLRLI